MTKRIGFICLALGLMVVLSVGSAFAAKTLKAYVDLDQDGVYQKVGEYNVTFEEALRAFAATGGVPAQPGEALLNFKGVPDVSFAAPQSWEAFLSFVDETYPSAVKDAEQAVLCDNTVWVRRGSLEWVCDGLQCIPTDECTGQFASATADFICKPLGDPPCPPGTSCRPIANALDIAAFNTVNGTACHCVSDNCVIDENAEPDGTGILFDNDVCQCMGGGRVPSMTPYGFVVLALLLMATAAWVLRSRFATE